MEPIQTDQRIYTLRETEHSFEAEAVATYVNETGRPVAYERCRADAEGPIYSVVRVGPDSGERSLVGGVWACVGGVPTGLVPPRGTLTARVWLGSLKSPNAQPPDRPEDRIGTFRIHFALCSEPAADSDACVPLPERESRSNVFEIRYA